MSLPPINGAAPETADAARPATAGRAAEHLHRLWESFTLRSVPARARRQRQARHSRQGALRRAIGRDVVDFYHWLQERGHTLRQSAARLSLAPRTLRHWDRRYQAGPAPLFETGRPAARSPRRARQAVLGFIQQESCAVGVPKLQAQFPGMARAELADLVQRCRRVVRRRHPACQRVLHWRQPGRVWAIDWAEPSESGRVLPAIDGQFPYLLAVRDLASGYQLAWLPVSHTTSDIAVTILTRLFTEHGAPLVLKSDNGPSFRSAIWKNFLEQAGVFSLFSPPHWPGYNGAIEAAIGSLKTRTANAAGVGRDSAWSSAHVESACRQANTSRPRRLCGRTPRAVWQERTSIPALERACFELTVQRHRWDTRTEMNIDQEAILDHWQGGKLDRQALQRALVEHDYLLFSRRRLPLIINPGKVTFIV